MVIAVAVGILATAGAYFLYNREINRVPATRIAKRVTIPAGATARRIGEILAAEGLITSARPFVWYCKLHGLDGKLRAGEYLLRSEDGIPALARKLAAGEVYVVKFTVPEGCDIKKTARIIAAAGICPAEEFIAAASAPGADPRVAAPTLEGYLFPDTYEAPAGTGAKGVIKIMTDRFFQVMGPEAGERAAAAGRTLHEVVTVASIVEREALRPEEKPLVAAVFYNRLKKGMKLESCATVIYARDRQPGRLTVEDLKVDSPYNTYRHAGLPPGPICSPGKEALLAALDPADVDYLFFVSNGDGTHTFSRTFAEHLAARAAARRRQKS